MTALRAVAKRSTPSVYNISMRFALLGSHPDGLEMASALVETGGHELIAWTGRDVPRAHLERWGSRARLVSDLEEVLADPAIELVIVAGSPANRALQLRRALQSERHVLCVHPADQSSDIGHEAAMIQGDTKCVLLPLLPGTLHPAFDRLSELIRASVGAVQLIELTWSAREEVLREVGTEGYRPSVPGWDVLRRLGGEIAEVSSFTVTEELQGGEPVLLAGRFERGGLFQMTLLPRQPTADYRLNVIGSLGRAELYFPLGWLGPAFLSWHESNGERREEAWPAWDPWPSMAAVVGRALKGEPPAISWQDAVRCLELDDAARRSAERRRSSLLEYAEASEEVGFKGTMTLVGCGLLWAVLLLLILSRWLPWLGYVVLPVLVVFLGFQLLRWIIPAGPPAKGPGPPGSGQP